MAGHHVSETSQEPTADAGGPRYPDVVVELPADGDTGTIRSRTHKALSSGPGPALAELYLNETNLYRDYPAELVERTRSWVTTVGDVDELPDGTALPTNASHSALAEGLGEPLGRWQYAIANVGTFNSPDRMASVLATAGANGWELVAIYDKSSNWFQGFEKGFMLLKRPVPEGAAPSSWCVTLRA